jgi:hypothetical protein
MNTPNRPNTPMSGGPKGALSSRGAESAARGLKRLWAAVTAKRNSKRRVVSRPSRPAERRGV